MLYSIICLTFIFGQTKILWDLGVTITNQQDMQDGIVKPLIADTQIEPTYKNIYNKNLIDFQNSTIPPKHTIKILYISERYFELSNYIKSINNQHLLSDDEIIIYSDSLYRLGLYDDAIICLNNLSSNYPDDEKYFTLALYNKKQGNVENMMELLNQLIQNYPNSDYIKLAELQLNGFR